MGYKFGSTSSFSANPVPTKIDEKAKAARKSVAFLAEDVEEVQFMTSYSQFFCPAVQARKLRPLSALKEAEEFSFNSRSVSAQLLQVGGLVRPGTGLQRPLRNGMLVRPSSQGTVGALLQDPQASGRFLQHPSVIKAQGTPNRRAKLPPSTPLNAAAHFGQALPQSGIASTFAWAGELNSVHGLGSSMPPAPSTESVRARAQEQRRAIMELLADQDLEKKTKNKFKANDFDKSGSLNFNELRSTLRTLHTDLGLPFPDDNMVERLLKKFDTAGRGSLDLEQFFQLFVAALRRNAFDRSAILGRDFFVTHHDGSVWDRYEKVKEIGRGSFGIAYLARQRFTGEDRVVKAVKKSRVQIPVEDVEIEIMVMRQVDHPHVVRLRRWYEDKNHIFLIMDFLKGGTLRDVVLDFKKQKQSIKEGWVRKVVQQVAQGMAYCHSLRLIHKDLKDENIMLLNKSEPFSPDSEPFAVIIDLGITDMFSSVDRHSHHIGGTPVTMAPEVWSGTFGPKCDVWSLGCVLFELLSGSMPFTCNTMQPAAWIRLHKRGPSYSLVKTSPTSKALCQEMLSCNEDKRPSMSGMLDHEWFKLDTRVLVSIKPAQFAALEEFCQSSALKRSLLLELASRLPMEDADDIIKIFKEVDTGDTGRVSLPDLSEAFKRMGLPADLAKRTIRVLDLDGDGQLSFTEFSSLLLLLHQDLLEDRFNKLLAEYGEDKKDEGSLVGKGAERFLDKLGGMIQTDGPCRSRDILNKLRSNSKETTKIGFKTLRDNLLGPSALSEVAAEGRPSTSGAEKRSVSAAPTPMGAIRMPSMWTTMTSTLQRDPARKRPPPLGILKKG